jgi:hypothetical protein
MQEMKYTERCAFILRRSRVPSSNRGDDEEGWKERYGKNSIKSEKPSHKL